MHEFIDPVLGLFSRKLSLYFLALVFLIYKSSVNSSSGMFVAVRNQKKFPINTWMKGGGDSAGQKCRRQHSQPLQNKYTNTCTLLELYSLMHTVGCCTYSAESRARVLFNVIYSNTEKENKKNQKLVSIFEVV
jgi:hypothetical protein